MNEKEWMIRDFLAYAKKNIQGKKLLICKIYYRLWRRFLVDQKINLAWNDPLRNHVLAYTFEDTRPCNAAQHSPAKSPIEQINCFARNNYTRCMYRAKRLLSHSASAYAPASAGGSAGALGGGYSVRPVSGSPLNQQ